MTSAQFNKPSDNKTYYVASAPRSKKHEDILGDIFIFDIIDSKFTSVKKLHGSQFGDYFGYSLLVEDFNNDDLPDLAVSAPLYSIDTYHENGAVYIFLNEGNVSYF